MCACFDLIISFIIWWAGKPTHTNTLFNLTVRDYFKRTQTNDLILCTKKVFFSFRHTLLWIYVREWVFHDFFCKCTCKLELISRAITNTIIPHREIYPQFACINSWVYVQKCKCAHVHQPVSQLLWAFAITCVHNIYKPKLLIKYISNVMDYYLHGT